MSILPSNGSSPQPGRASSPGSDAVAALAAAVLEEEAQLVDEGPDEALLDREAATLGSGEEAMSLAEALRAGGSRTLFVLAAIGAVQLMDGGVFNVLAPDIQSSLGVSDTVLGALGGATGLLFVIGAIPMSSLSDRLSRKTLLGAVMTVWSIVILLTGFVQSVLQMFLVRMGAGLGQSTSLPVTSPLLMDTYPIPSRGRIFAVLGGVSAIGTALTPFLAGGIAELAGGDEGWRFAFLALGIVALPVSLLAFTLREPRRGAHEMQSVLGEELPPEEDPLPISLGVAFERLGKIQSFYYLLLGMAALGFALFTAPLFLSLYFDDELGLDAFQRGLISTIIAVPTLITLTIAGRRVDALFRRAPPAAMAFIGLLVALFGICLVTAVNMPNVVTVVAVLAIGTSCAQAAFTILPAVISTIIPYRLRARGTTMVGLYVFLCGGFFGAILAGMLSDAYGTRTALVVMVLPSTVLGGALIALGSRHIREDMAMVVEELREEQEERVRMQSTDTVTPVLQVRNLDFAYGRVQILFDINFDLHRGETLALLGTNGAGKSTLLRVISGLGVARRGVVRLNGRTVTYADPEIRVQVGIVQLIGGGATFPALTVEENLRMGAYLYSTEEQDRRIGKVLELFPTVAHRRSARAAELSGGQQQMLALAMTLLHEPEVLIIDELSLGLAPFVVQEVLVIIRQLQAAGQTIIVVEQSLNVALSIADRALFMEKGQIRFEGPAEELVARDDLARAVFLGTEQP